MITAKKGRYRSNLALFPGVSDHIANARECQSGDFPRKGDWIHAKQYESAESKGYRADCSIFIEIAFKIANEQWYQQTGN